MGTEVTCVGVYENGTYMYGGVPVRLSVFSHCSPLSTGILYGRLQRVTIPEAVIIEFVLLRMSKLLLKTC